MRLSSRPGKLAGWGSAEGRGFRRPGARFLPSAERAGDLRRQAGKVRGVELGFGLFAPETPW